VSFLAAQRQADTSLQQLYDDGKWFELQDAVQGQDTSALFRGAVASAFNRVEDAERYLRQAIQSAADAKAGNEAREVLAKLYLRLGRSSAAGRLMGELLQSQPQEAGIENVRIMFGAYSDRPDQTAQVHQPASFPCEVSDAGVHIPLSINDRAATWLLDTGANVTVLSEAEAKMLGVVVEDARSRLDDLAGRTTTVRTARLQRLVIGGTELRNVPTVVLPDSQPPFNDVAPGRRGLIGLPVALALGTVGWTRAGMCQTGPVGPRRTDNPPNLAFSDFQPLTRVAFNGGPLDFVLDTGNQAGTQLWERFGRDFSPLVKERGRTSTQRVNQIGGSNEHEVTVISELPLRVGGRDVVLKPAIIFSRPVGDQRRHGNLGMDLLSQAAGVTIDFGSMSLTLR
jgi:hypothetical protein